MTILEQETAVTQKADTYKLFAACFYEPEKQLFLEENVCDNLSRLLLAFTADGADAAAQMQTSLHVYEQQQLSIDHASLFLGPFELIAAPYGSVWLEKKRQVMGDSTIAVIDFYEKVGLQTDVNEPPDHIAIMLEFMSYLCRREAQALSESKHDEAANILQLQNHFLQDAIGPWCPLFCDAIIKGTDNSFYIGLAKALKYFLESEQNNRT